MRSVPGAGRRARRRDPPRRHQGAQRDAGKRRPHGPHGFRHRPEHLKRSSQGRAMTSPAPLCISPPKCLPGTHARQPPRSTAWACSCISWSPARTRSKATPALKSNASTTARSSQAVARRPAGSPRRLHPCRRTRHARRNPQERYQSAGELEAALARARSASARPNPSPSASGPHRTGRSSSPSPQRWSSWSLLAAMTVPRMHAAIGQRPSDSRTVDQPGCAVANSTRRHRLERQRQPVSHRVCVLPGRQRSCGAPEAWRQTGAW